MVSGMSRAPLLPAVKWASETCGAVAGLHELAKVSVGLLPRCSGSILAHGSSLGAKSGNVLTEHGALFLLLTTDDVRLFAFVRFTTGDAMSKRSKFALITWIGENVSGLQRAKTGTDKTLVKEVVQVSGLGSFLGLGGSCPTEITIPRDGVGWVELLGWKASHATSLDPQSH